MERNADLFRAVGEFIVEHPENYSQDVFGDGLPDFYNKPVTTTAKNICGTVHCIAGTAMLLSGYKFSWRTIGKISAFYRYNGTKVEDYNEEAAGLFGITLKEARELFSSGFGVLTEDEESGDIIDQEPHTIRKLLYAIADGADIQECMDPGLV